MSKPTRASGHYTDKPKTKAPVEQPAPMKCCCDVKFRIIDGVRWDTESAGCPFCQPTIALLGPQRERKMTP